VTQNEDKTNYLEYTYDMEYDRKHKVATSEMSEKMITFAIEVVEEVVEKMYEAKFAGTTKPPDKDTFKASAMAEIARRIKNKAH